MGGRGPCCELDELDQHWWTQPPGHESSRCGPCVWAPPGSRGRRERAGAGRCGSLRSAPHGGLVDWLLLLRGASEEGRFARRGRRPATRSAAPLAPSCDLGACAAWPPVSLPGPGVRGSSFAPSHPWPARRGVKTVTRPLQTGTWRLQSGGAGWRGPRHSVPPLHALTRGRRAPSAARGAFTLPWAPATRGREGGVRGLRSSSSYLGTQERNLVPRKTTLESQPEAGGRPPSRRRRARLPLLAGGAPKWGPRGTSSASLCAFCPLSLKTSACEGARDVRCGRLWRHLSGGAWGPGSGPRTQTARAKAAAGYRGACSDSPQLAVGDVG